MHKCECYWVNVQGEERQFGNITVSFAKARQVCPDFIVRTLKINYITDGGNSALTHTHIPPSITEERTICQFHYVLWPDHGVPETVRPLLDMVRLVRDYQASETLPVLVHCSAGCGRTGTICAIVGAPQGWGEGDASAAMVQTREQYILLHRAVRELFKERLKVIAAHPYENIPTDSKPLILREKENDCEELHLRPEKQDKSAKPVPASTTAPSVAATQTDSLTCYTHMKDFPEFSSPTATLDWLGSTVPPRHMKYTKPQQSSPSSASHTPCQASPSHQTPLPQPSPLSPACVKAVVSSVPVPSPSQAQIGYMRAAQVPQLPTTSPQVLNSSPQVPNNSHKCLTSPQKFLSSPSAPHKALKSLVVPQ
ncbi:tyrosine-protein phosphatase non-receptor type 12-like isoform X2 [Eriocheir sinensis]|uniref:tyrosine-protein phosphatase non-receptor type 12-like isoform X2 n=1 Tax=Eriocheir sinensis TaxID=95602 RepID=UPI0021C5EB73|nr:tyrosine-protein phosphatase non-receptor type 12-like isoform X2 [Eriocheir sinensis]